MSFLQDDGRLVIARWATRHEATGNEFEWLTVDADKPGQVPMYGTKAMADALVSNGQLGVDLIKVPAGEGFAPHVHPGDHLLIVVAGRGTITYDGRIYETQAGEVYLIEGSVPHAVGAITDHAILAVGSPHRAPDAADRMSLTAYAAVAAELGTLTCLACGLMDAPDELRRLGCAHVPVEPGAGKPLVVGMAPANEDQPAAFVGTQSGERLCRLLEVGPGRLLDAVDTTNLCPVPVDDWQAVRPSVWDDYAAALHGQIGGRVVVACGRTVARALLARSLDHAPWGSAHLLTDKADPPALVVLIPHPSGLSRSWNDPGTAGRATAALRLARTFARVEPPRGQWCQADADALSAAALAGA